MLQSLVGVPKVLEILSVGADHEEMDAQKKIDYYVMEKWDADYASHFFEKSPAIFYKNLIFCSIVYAME